MFQKPPVEITALEEAIDRLHGHMLGVNITSEEYANAVEHLTKLHALKEAEKPLSMTPGEKATLIANLTGILLILNFERAGVVTTKALSFIMKLR